MFFVCLSHSSAYVDSAHWWFAEWLMSVGMIASPTFLLVSGIVSGYLGATATSVEYYRRRLLDRGLFLLLVVHFVIALTYTSWLGTAAVSQSFYITDSVAVGLIIASALVPRATPRALAGFGVVLLMAAWLVESSTAPSSVLGRGAEKLLFGLFAARSRDEGYIVPLIPYLGIFLIGVAAGIEFVRLRGVGLAMKQLATRCITLGVQCMVTALALKLMWLGIKPYLWPDVRPLLYEITDPRQKIPPSLAYVLAYGGAGATMLGLLGTVAATALGGRVLSWLAVVGRASLAVFVVQYYVYYFPARVLNVGVGHWAALFPASLVLLWVFAWTWNRFDGNRFFTLGISHVGGRVPHAPVKGG
jgi:hypothetical protein